MVRHVGAFDRRTTRSPTVGESKGSRPPDVVASSETASRSPPVGVAQHPRAVASATKSADLSVICRDSRECRTQSERALIRSDGPCGRRQASGVPGGKAASSDLPSAEAPPVFPAGDRWCLCFWKRFVRARAPQADPSQADVLQADVLQADALQAGFGSLTSGFDLAGPGPGSVTDGRQDGGGVRAVVRLPR